MKVVLHSQVASGEHRKVVLATNVAETGISLSYVVFNHFPIYICIVIINKL